MKNHLLATSRAGEDGESRLLTAPTVGRYYLPPPVGTFLAPGSEMGVLKVLTRAYRLQVPAGVTGVVREILASVRGAPLEFGQPILSLGRAADPAVFDPEVPAEGLPEAERVPEGMIAVRSPTDGIFYRRASPEDPAYVEEGAVVERGKVLGLVEVMKCFNQISYGGRPDDPERVRVVRILPLDAHEVKLDQLLILLEPA